MALTTGRIKSSLRWENANAGDDRTPRGPTASERAYTKLAKKEHAEAMAKIRANPHVLTQPDGDK